MLCAKGLHQTAEACISKTPPPRDPADYVFGRYVGDGPVEGGVGGTSPTNYITYRVPGILSQPGEVPADPIPGNTILGFSDRLQGDENNVDGGESGTDGGNLQGHPTEAVHLSPRTSQADRKDDSYSTCDLPGPNVVPGTAALEESSIAAIAVLRPHSEVEPGSSVGAQMVVHQDEHGKRKEHTSTGARPDSGNGCINAGMGSSLHGCPNRRTVVSGGTRPSHKLPGTASGHVGSEDIHQEPGECACTSAHGQQDSSFLCEPHGRDPVPNNEQTGNPVLAVVSDKERVPVSRVSTRPRQLHSGRGIQKDPVISGVEAETGSVSADNGGAGRMLSGSVCFSAQCPADAVCQLEARSECDGNGRSATPLEQVDRLRLPTILSDRGMPQEGQGGQGISGASGSNMEIPALVSSSARSPNRLPPDPPSRLRSSGGPLQQSAPTDGNRPVASSRLETIRQRQLAAGISGETSQLLAAGWSSGTNRAYESAWKKWDSWCSEQQVDPISCPVQPFLEFLASLYQSGMQYRSINTIRSAISMTHDHVEGIPMGQHPLVSRLLKGVYNLRPPQPRYTATWDVDIVVRFFQALGNNGTLPLKILSQKLALLMALVDASRVSELQALDLRYRLYRPEGVVFSMPTLGKKRIVGAPPKQVMFGAFPEDDRLCVVKCLKHYEAVTMHHRNKEPGSPQPLFLSYIKPHGPVTSQRIAHWLKEILGKAGVDTSTFKAHSVRGASSTAASEKGVLIEDILRTADWSSDSTFQRFYYRPSQQNSYAQAVLHARPGPA